MISIDLDRQAVERAQLLLKKSPKKIKAAANEAINKTLGSLQKQFATEAQKKYKVKTKGIRTNTRIQRAKGNATFGKITSYGNGIPLSRFGVKPVAGRVIGKKYRKLLRVEILKGKSAAVKNTFWVQRKNGYRGLFRRYKGNRSYPIGELYGPSVPTMLGSEGVHQELMNKAETFLNSRFRHNIEYYLGNLGGK